MNKKIISLVLLLSLLTSSLLAFAQDNEETVPPTVQVPSAPIISNLPDLNVFIGENAAVPEVPTPDEPTPDEPTPDEPTPPSMPQQTRPSEEVNRTESNRTQKTDEASLLIASEAMIARIEEQERENPLSNRVVQKEIIIESIDGNVSLPPLNSVFQKIDVVSIETQGALISIDKNSLADFSEELSLSVNWLEGGKIIQLQLKSGSENIHHFIKPITIKVPYTLTEDEDPAQLTAFYIDNNGTSTPIPGRYEEGTFVFKTSHFSRFYVAENRVLFNDLEASDWVYQYVKTMSSKGVIQGTSKTNFTPKKTLSRAEFFALLSRILRYGTQPVELPYVDVLEDAWYTEDIRTLYVNGYFEGLYSSAYLEPNSPITRNEVAILSGKLLQGSGYKMLDHISFEHYKDMDQLSDLHLDYVRLSLEHSILIGHNDFLMPQSFLTREQGAAVIYRLFHK